MFFFYKLLSVVVCQLFQDMERLISDEPFPGKEEVENILSAYARSDRSPKDEERFQNLEDAWNQPGQLSAWPSHFLDRVNSTFDKHILKPDAVHPFPNHLMQEGACSIHALQALWSAAKKAYHEELQTDVIFERHRLKEQDIMSGSVVEEADGTLPSSLSLGSGRSYLAGTDGRLAFYFGRPERMSLPLPTTSMISFLNSSFSQSPGAITEVRRRTHT